MTRMCQYSNENNQLKWLKEMNCHTRRTLLTVKMSKPDVRVNSFFKNRSYCVDPISKMFIITETILGLNHLSLFGNVKSINIKIGYAYSAFVLVVFHYFMFYSYFWLVPISANNFSYFIIIVVSSLLWKRLRSYFTQLSLFDKEVDCEIKLSRTSKYNLVQCVFSVSCCISILIVELICQGFAWYGIFFLLMRLLHTVQFYFSAHLLHLLVIRMQLVNFLFESYHPNGDAVRPLDKAVEFRSQKQFKLIRMIDYFNRIIKAYDTLNHAIKWQMLFIFIELFQIAMRDLYYITMLLLTKKFDIDGTLMLANILMVQFFPMLSVCMSGDRLHKEVLWLREMLACRLYEGRLDNRDRRPAKALLTLTEARNLSFSLFHMFNVDISLPFKMFSLLITNIIILLQFEKVRNNSLIKQTLLD